MGRNAIALFAAAMSLTVLAGSPAHAAAVVVPPPVVGGGCSDDSIFPFTVLTSTGSCKLGGASSSLSLLPAVQAGALAISAGPGNAVSAGTGVQYFFEITGGNQGDHVPVIITTNLFTSISSSAGARAGITVDTDLLNRGLPAFTAAATACSSNSSTACIGSNGASFTGALSLPAIDGVRAEVDISALIDAVDGGSGFAIADPMIVIDPTFANASQYTLTISPGVGNALPSVPEPSSWALMILGAGLAGSALRRRRPLVPGLG
jgi:hypothetical protein